MKTKSKVEWLTPARYRNWGTNIVYIGTPPTNLSYVDEQKWYNDHAIKDGVYYVQFPDGTEEDIRIVNIVDEDTDYDHGHTSQYDYNVPHFEIIHNGLKFHSPVYGGRLCKILKQ